MVVFTTGAFYFVSTIPTTYDPILPASTVLEITTTIPETTSTVLVIVPRKKKLAPTTTEGVSPVQQIAPVTETTTTTSTLPAPNIVPNIAPTIPAPTTTVRRWTTTTEHDD